MQPGAYQMDASSLAETTIDRIAPQLLTAKATVEDREADRQHWLALRVANERRLRALEVQAAQKGNSTDPAVTIEIEDLRNKLEQLTQQLNRAEQPADLAGWSGELADALKSKLSGDPYAQQSLMRLMADPDSRSRRSALAGVLEEIIAADAGFAKTLQTLLDTGNVQGGDTITESVTLSGHARAQDIIQIGKASAGIDLGKNH